MSTATIGRAARTELKVETTISHLRQRAARAGRWMDGWDRVFSRHIRKDIRQCCREAAQAVEDRVPWQSLQPRWERRTSELRMRLALSMMPEAYRFCEAMWFGAPVGLQDVHATIDAAFEAEPFLARKMEPLIEGYVHTTVRLEGEQQAAWIALYLHKARGNNLTVAETAAYLVKEAEGMAPSRARMLARTTTTWNYSKASSLAYRDYGIEVGEWIAAIDELTCPFCNEFDQMKFRLGDAIVDVWEGAAGELVVGEETLALPYAIYHPPLHPNCRCTIAPDLEHVTVRRPDESTKPAAEKGRDVPLDRYGGLTKNQAREVSNRADEVIRTLEWDEVLSDEQWAWVQGPLTDDQMDQLQVDLYQWVSRGPNKLRTALYSEEEHAKIVQALAEQGRPDVKTLWRGMSFDTTDDMDDFLAVFADEVVDLPDLASASVSREIGEDFAMNADYGILLEIRSSKARIPGFNIGSLIEVESRSEMEIILPQGLRLRAVQMPIEAELADPDIVARVVAEIVAE